MPVARSRSDLALVGSSCCRCNPALLLRREEWSYCEKERPESVPARDAKALSGFGDAAYAVTDDRFSPEHILAHRVRALAGRLTLSAAEYLWRRQLSACNVLGGEGVASAQRARAAAVAGGPTLRPPSARA